MNELALFAGAGGGILAGKLLGWRTVCAVERDEYCRKVLLQRQRDGILDPFPIWSDVRSFDGRPWRGLVDVVSGGFPCQGYSGAARGRTRATDLWPEMLRIVADVAPRYVFAENVVKRAIDKAADELEPLGYRCRAIALGAHHLGGDHPRVRYWLAAHADMHGELRLREHAEVAQLPELRPRVWEAGPDEPRMADGMAYRMDRLAATGNGQVPSVAAAAWRILNCENDPAHTPPSNTQ